MWIDRLSAPRRVRLAVLAVTILALAGMLAGCSASGYGGSVDEPQAEFAPADGSGAGGFIPEERAEGGVDYSDRAMITTGNMYMTVEDPIGAADAATAIVQAAGGRIDGRSERAADEWQGGSAQLVMRIPAPALEAVVEDLRKLGTVDEFATTAADVTNEVRDLNARISTLRASTERIEALLAQAKDISDIITLENELANRQAELESLEARQRGLDDQVSLSTIQLSLTTEPVVFVDDSPKTFLDGLESGWKSLVAFFAWALVVFGVLLPWLLLIALIAAVIVFWVRARRAAKTRRAAAVPPAPPAAPPTASAVPSPAPKKPAAKKPAPKK